MKKTGQKGAAIGNFLAGALTAFAAILALVLATNALAAEPVATRPDHGDRTRETGPTVSPTPAARTREKCAGLNDTLEIILSHDEKIIFAGASRDGESVLMVWADPEDGSWTLTRTETADRDTICIVDFGTNAQIATEGDQ